MVDAPYAPIERTAPEIPRPPVELEPHAPPVSDDGAPQAVPVESVRERTLFDRLVGQRIEPIFARRARPAAPAAAPVEDELPREVVTFAPTQVVPQAPVPGWGRN